jgi:hypothetical protein
VIEATRRSAFEGIGEPEPLKGDLSGWWARRITDEHRLVYRVAGTQGARILEMPPVVFIISDAFRTAALAETVAQAADQVTGSSTTTGISRSVFFW